MSEEKDTGKQVEEDAKEDLDLEVEDADKVGGGNKLGKYTADGKHLPEATITL
jgi:hypothetical protein